MKVNPKYTDFISHFSKLKNLILSPLAVFYFRCFGGVKIGKECKFVGWPIIRCRQGGKIFIGNEFNATSSSLSNPAGVPHPVIISSFGDNAIVTIGNNVGVSGVSINCWNKIDIRENVMIGAGTAIWDTDFHPTDSYERFINPSNAKTAPIIINKNTFIGARVIILKGVNIGENCVIAAGAVINKDIPDNCVVYGNPMIIKQKL